MKHRKRRIKLNFSCSFYQVDVSLATVVKTFLIAPFIDIPMFYIKYHAMNKVQMHAGAIRQLLYGSCVRTGANPLAKARGLSSRT